MKTKLKIGLLLDDLKASAWEYSLIERINESSYASIELLVLNDVKKNPNNSIFAKIKNNLGSIISTIIQKLLVYAQNKWIDRVNCVPDAFEQKNLECLLFNVPVIKVKPIQKKLSDRFCDSDINQIKSFEIDVFIRLGFRILRGAILNSSKYGIWSYHHGDNFINRGGPAGFWEAMESWPETGSILQILTEDLDNGRVLYRSYSCTYDLSVSFNRNNYFWKSLSFIPRKLKELYDVGGEKFLAKVEKDNVHPTFYSNRLFVRPTNSEYIKLILKKSIQKIRNNFVFRFYFDQWFLMFDLNENFSGSLWRFKKILPPKDRFWADPHVLYKNGNYYIYIEEFLYKTQKGHIALIVMDKKGNYKEPIKIIEKPYHLSYPFIFEWNNEIYMVPETGENRTIELYRCIEFPNKWEFETNLMENIEAFDTTLFYSEGKWWMFTNIVENKGASSWDELFLFYSKDLFSNNWMPHPLNPIVSDVKRARSAGKIFRKNGRIYRPSQNCSIRYGYGFNLCEIITLNENEYNENIVASVKPNWNKDIIAAHTFSREHSLTIIDGQMRRRR